VLLLADGVFLVQSRIAMTNVFALFFQLAAVLAIVSGVLRDRLRVVDFAVGGLFQGLALSTRWTSLWAWGFLGLTVVAVRRTRLLSLRELGLSILAFVVLPAALYVTSYVPWMGQGHTIREVIDLQKGIWSYHAHLDATHPYFSAWWTWPWLYRPTWYFYRAEAGTVRGIFALGNPALWWAAVPVTFWALLTAARERNPRLLFAGAGFVLLYVPWGISPRTLNYSHYLFEAIPYACLALGTLLDRHWSRPEGALPSRGYVTVVVLLFVLFVPFLMGLPVPESWWGWRIPHGPGLWTWFPRWV
jgi:dolichyl-phosphate-mannose--protein O-mannosyl transferase